MSTPTTSADDSRTVSGPFKTRAISNHVEERWMQRRADMSRNIETVNTYLDGFPEERSRADPVLLDRRHRMDRLRCLPSDRQGGLGQGAEDGVSAVGGVRMDKGGGRIQRVGGVGERRGGGVAQGKDLDDGQLQSNLPPPLQGSPGGESAPRWGGGSPPPSRVRGGAPPRPSLPGRSDRSRRPWQCRAADRRHACRARVRGAGSRRRREQGGR